MMTSNIPRWESSKENAAPLRRGRKVDALEFSMATQSNEETRIVNEGKILEFERIVQQCEVKGFEALNVDDGSDPLKQWVTYIQFYQDSFPSDTFNQVKLLERCFRCMSKINIYKNDDRFIKVCCVFADKSKRPHDIFKYCHEQLIGAECSIFWIAWAFVAEKEGNFPFAEKIFEKGLRKKAKPMQLMQQRFKQFQRRMSRHWLNSTNVDECDEEDVNTSQRSRATLGYLDEESVLANDRSRRVASIRSNGSRQRHGLVRAEPAKTAFSVFVDENAENVENMLEQSFTEPFDTPFHSDADLLKENTLAPAPWNKHGGLMHSYTQRNKAPESRRAPPPAFNVYIDQECKREHERVEKERTRKEEEDRQLRDERTFRERTVDRAWEKVSQDPLRYVRNPSKLEKEKISDEVHDKLANPSNPGKLDAKLKKTIPPKNSSGATMKTNNDSLKSFEEARFEAKYFRLLTSESNFNKFVQLPRSEESDTLRATKNESDDGYSVTYLSKNELKDEIDKKRTIAVARETRSNLSADYSDIYPFPTPRNASTASSTVDEAFAVGVPGPREEQTINTALAQKEISMMFFGSPQICEPKKQATLFDIDEFPTEAFGVLDPDHSFAPVESEPVSRKYPYQELSSGKVEDCETEKIKPTNAFPFARNPDTQSEKLGCESASLGFNIFSDLPSNNDSTCTSTRNTYRSDPGEKNSENQFSIYEDFACTDQGVSHSSPDYGKHPSTCVQIDKEPELMINSLKDADDVLDTLEFSQLGILLTEYNHCEKSADDRDNKPVLRGTCAFEIFADSDDACKETYSPHGDDATMSIVDLIVDEMSCVSKRIKSESVQIRPVTKDEGFGRDTGALIVDNGSDTASWTGIDETIIKPATEEKSSKRFISDQSMTMLWKEVVDMPIFDDISFIAESQDHTLTMTPYSSECCFSYHKIHGKALRNALDSINDSVRENLPKDYSLAASNAMQPTVYDLSTHALPRPLKTSMCLDGTSMTVSSTSAKIKRELKRDSFGVLALLKTDDGSKDHVFIKIQSPNLSLAWEFSLLQRLESRIRKQYQNCNFYPFPSGETLLSLADGAILRMSSASTIKINLRMLSTLYERQTANIPEVIVLYYTSLMLNCVEQMHWHGKILHCNITPDNWLVASNEATEHDEAGKHSDLILVEFGNSIDLLEHTPDPLNAKFTDVVFSSSRCAAMRENLSWSFDVDTFGVCACSHWLLFGCELEVKRKNNSQWMLKHEFKRNMQRDLWSQFFESLLNVDEVTMTAIGSRPHSLRQLRSGIEEYLSTKKIELETALQKQSLLITEFTKNR